MSMSEAVDALSLPRIAKVIQSNEDEQWVTELRHEPLLIQLRDAVVGGVGKHAGSSPGNERIPFDSSALELFDHISKTINGWYLAVPVPRTHMVISDRLRAWYVHHANLVRGGRVSREVDDEATRTLNGWVTQITAKFDPPTILELRHLVTVGKRQVHKPAQCPMEACGAEWAMNPATGERITALVVEYREIGAETLDEAVGICRSCGTEWRGRFALRSLRYQLDQQHATEAA